MTTEPDTAECWWDWVDAATWVADDAEPEEER